MRELEATLQRALLRRRMPFLGETAFEPVREPVQADTCEACRGRTLNEAGCSRIRHAYRSADRNIALTARRLGLSRTTVYKHVQ